MLLHVKTCLCMFKHAQAISLLLVLKPATEQVFSLLSNSFKENQQNALEDYICTSIMLQKKTLFTLLLHEY